jgi:hypothetical protein
VYLGPILHFLNLQLQLQRCSRLERFNIGKKFNLKTRHAINSSANFYNAGVVIRDRRIVSWGEPYDRELQRQRSKNLQRQK